MKVTTIGAEMADKVTPPNDLTSTLNLRQLRAIPEGVRTDDLYKSLTTEQQDVVKNLPNGAGILLVLKVLELVGAIY